MILWRWRAMRAVNSTPLRTYSLTSSNEPVGIEPLQRGARTVVTWPKNPR